MVKVRVPASSANLGPGFDVLGMALKLYNYITMEDAGEGLEIKVNGEGEGNVVLTEKNTVYKIAEKVFNTTGFKPKGLRIELTNRIPVARGLGSSAAALAGGAVAANVISGSHLTQEKLLELAVEIEGHPDNVVPAMLGGITLSTFGHTKMIYRKIEPPEDLAAVVAIPFFELSTKAARDVLPKTVKLGDAVFNVGNTALLVHAFETGELDLIRDCMKDRLHQPYRSQLVPGMEDVFDAAKDAGAFGAALSGAGPTLIAFSGKEDTDAVKKSMQEAFAVHGIRSVVEDLSPEAKGALIL